MPATMSFMAQDLLYRGSLCFFFVCVVGEEERGEFVMFLVAGMAAQTLGGVRRGDIISWVGAISLPPHYREAFLKVARCVGGEGLEPSRDTSAIVAQLLICHQSRYSAG